MSQENNPKKFETTTKVFEDVSSSAVASNEPSSYEEKKGNIKFKETWKNFADSFKEAERDEEDYSNLTDIEKIARKTANTQLQKSLGNIQLQMIAIGGSIGTGLFVGSGKALANGGPAALLIAWLLIGSMLFVTVHALGELSVKFPVSGSFVTFNTKFISPAWGFAMAWNYALQWLVAFPLELVAASITIDFWGAKVNHAVFIFVFWVLIVALNLFGVEGFGYGEVIFSAIKIITVIGFVFLGVILDFGGSPNHQGYIGGKFWVEPGSFSNGFKGVCTVFLTAAFSFSGTELCCLAACESANPSKSLPKATKQVFWRILLFYVISLTLVGLLVPYNDPRLFGSSKVDASASPFVIAIENAGIKGLPSVMNAVIMISVLSVGNSAIYACSRTLTALSASYAPAFMHLDYVDRKGRPLVSIAIASSFGLIAFISADPVRGHEAFIWMSSLSGLSCILTWMSACISHIRFRRALKVQNRSTDELPFKSQGGVIGSYYGAILNFLVLVANFWVAMFPIGSKPDPKKFFQDYLSIPFVLAFYFAYMIYKKDFRVFIKAKDIDIDSGAREDVEALIEEVHQQEQELRQKSWYIRIYRTWC
ncbi:hypothetical protein PACTADRAFT_38152 [Pachysolen tannophilus NRRL Y-2460]|uniref:Amino acid permease/ SLC12A domain-containing protein n=1 Tax=Pachysolen tannophilus NRRL Y-2460 TaxID=669874 RepID=A0A1E4U0N7_PACTA|nr:hypothetical protein PACTADRAFT_38152 [Pachysolen tannophilus NRRL Y-2460]